MRTFNTQITKQIAIGQSQGCVAVATGCERPFSAAQHLGLHSDRLHDSRRHDGRSGLGQLWHGLRTALVTNLQHTWHCAANCLDLAADALASAGTMQPTKSKSYRLPLSARYGMAMVGLVPVAVCRLPVAIATGTPMPRSADC
ncbi:MAG TPA: hypothetical protein VHY91_04710 [Pirellulales bacterium]|nr:hypothetical protein [Pirellulales bacterium]